MGDFVIWAEKKREELHMSGTDNISGDAPKGTGRTTVEQALVTPEIKTEEQIKDAYVGVPPVPLVGLIQIDDYDPEWPRLFAREARRIKAALGERVVLIEHVGST